MQRAAGSRSTGSRRSATILRDDGLAPVLAWTRPSSRSRSCCAPGESTGYGRRFVAERDTWIGIVPVGYADGFRRDLTGTEVLVDGERRRVVGAVSMDATAVELDRELPAGHAGDDRRARAAARGARARRRHDHLRARLRHRLVAVARPPDAGGRA